MDCMRFDIRDGLSQERREFDELVNGFYAVDASSLKDYLNTLKTLSQEKPSLNIFDGVDVDDLAQKIEGAADGYTEPSVAVYAACASLLMRVRNRLNKLPDKRIDYYYEKILGESTRGVEGDCAHVVFPTPAVGSNILLRAGSKFLAGIDAEGDDIEFESVKDSNINDAAVARIVTLAVNENMPASVAEIPVYSPKAAIESNELTPYPLFGLTRSGHRGVGANYARFGIGFSSPILRLHEGRREIKLNLVFDSNSARGTLLEQRDKSEEFIKTFSNAFKILMTTEEGWLEVDGYQVNAHVLDGNFAPNCIGLAFTLPESAPAIVNYDSEIHGEALECCHPVMKLELNPKVSYNPWNILRQLKLLKIQVEVKVNAFRLLEVSSEIGVLSLESPVQPFGPIPSIGNTFSFTSDEFCGKNLTALDLYGKWRGLPYKQNFAEWYRQYPEHPETEDFKVSIFSWNNGMVYPPENQKPMLADLFFETDEGISKRFHISFKDVLGPGNAKASFKMRLHSPEKAFLHQEQSKVLCHALMLQAQKKHAAAEIPNQPYTPELEDIYVSYQAKCEISTRSNSNGEKSRDVFFLGPWGYDFENLMNGDCGTLFIGLSCSEIPKSVNLYFHLKRDSEFVVSEDIGDYSWSVLCRDGWETLSKENVLYNTTAGFTTSGIVSLSLPAKMVRDNTMMAKDLIWICVRPIGDWKHCSRLFSVYAQGIEVKRCIKKGKDESFTHINSGTIKQLSKSAEGLSEVFQLESSFGGRAPETKEKMRTRVAEFLYHRGRALTSRDYERLILEAFPEVYMAKCFPGFKSDSYGKFEICPGCLTIVPVSKLVRTKDSSLDPCLGGKTLSDIKEFLKNIVPASAKIRVVNPFFEKIQVRCNVDIVDKFNEGETLQDLNEKINQYISPWFNVGINKIFGWTLNEDELKSYILSLGYVKAVSSLSILRIASSDTSKFLVDHSENGNSKILRGLCPWSVATPMYKHFLNIVSEIDKSRRISVGFGDLEIGSTFVIRRRDDAAK